MGTLYQFRPDPDEDPLGRPALKAPRRRMTARQRRQVRALAEMAAWFTFLILACELLPRLFPHLP